MTSPSFLIIGAQKCGTTSLYNYLVEHPHIKGANRKEIHFFDVYYDKGTDWYDKQFPSLNKHEITGEATPRYLFHSKCPIRVYQYNPNMKLIVLLRNPIDRAFSNYQMDLRNQSEKLKRNNSSSFLTFEETLETKLGNKYLVKGIYYQQLKKWLELFQLQQFHILESETLYQQPEKVMKRTFDFLELKQNLTRSYKIHHQGSYSPLSSKTRRSLTHYFKPYNLKLYELLGQKFDWD
ncbi:sulfotransferase domain-containing protein [Bacillus sp. JCM 19034]|uniref:sulfotransferase domain-containing protein n=1 Tax=Bacillus sp. JCM 19034 TaxID=1481928 RepID=UPI000782205B|nr:sulfotransferase domain-containing protein [Bacillus sp. JCM 19034]